MTLFITIIAILSFAAAAFLVYVAHVARADKLGAIASLILAAINAASGVAMGYIAWFG